MEQKKIIHVEDKETILQIETLQLVTNESMKKLIELAIDLYFEEMKKDYPEKFKKLIKDIEELVRDEGALRTQ